MASIIAKRTNSNINYYSSHKRDTKGRIEGVRVETYEVTLIEKPTDAMMYYALEPGFYYVACITKTKNSEKFGASQPRQHFKSDEERQAAIAKRLRKAGI